MKDTAQRQTYPHQTLHAGVPSDLARIADRAGIKQIISAFVPEGYVGDWINEATPALTDAGISFCERRRTWDELIWPHATAGFFKVKKKLPQVLEELELI